ncbi:MAG: Do family serine endopeptidase [Luteitalea sp.]|nr:Do family serine endopeptidase [Luteitalea sp.]
MDNRGINSRQWAARTAAAVAAAAVLVTGAAWQGSAADATTSAPQATATTAPQSIAGGRDSYADIVQVVAPAVVTIRTEGRARVAPTQFRGGDQEDMLRRFFGEQFGPGQRMPPMGKQRGLGSGVVVTADGYILTNHHVIDNAEDIRVELTDGRTFTANLVGSDKPSDLALLKIDATDLTALPPGNSDTVKVGDVVLAVGNPLGIGQTVTMGIISAKGRSTAATDGSYEDFLQTDAPINHGNSGGALVSTKGELVGINSQIISPSNGNIGIGFAIPANMARHVMEDLRKDGRVRRSQLGVTVQPMTSDMAEALGLTQVAGAIVSSVTPGSAADRAGVERGDIIRSFNNQAVQDTNALRNRVADATPGSKATVVVVRDGTERTLSVTLDEADASKSARATDGSGADDTSALGVAVAPLTPEVAARTGLSRDARGVVIQQVNPDGRAADAGLQPGDVILEVNRQPVHDVDGLRSALHSAPERPTLLLVHRAERGQVYLTVRPAA